MLPFNWITHPGQEIIKVKEWIPNIGPLSKVIPLKLFLDMVPSSSEDVTRALRECFPGTCRFALFQSKAKPLTLWGCLLWYVDFMQGSFGVCFNIFRKFNNRSLKKRRMSPAQTIITEWKAEKCLEKRVQNKRMPKHKLGNQTNTWSKYKCTQTIAAQVAKSSLSSNGNNSNVDSKMT